MPSSGVEVADEVTAAFTRIKTGDKDLHYVQYVIGNNKISIKRDAEGNQCWLVKSGQQEMAEPEFLELFKNECFYMVLDHKVKNNSKLVFIQWVPDDAKVKHKMLYASSSSSLKEKLDGVVAKIEANDHSDITFEAINAVIKTSTGNRDT